METCHVCRAGILNFDLLQVVPSHLHVKKKELLLELFNNNWNIKPPEERINHWMETFIVDSNQNNIHKNCWSLLLVFQLELDTCSCMRYQIISYHYLPFRHQWTTHSDKCLLWKNTMWNIDNGGWNWMREKTGCCFDRAANLRWVCSASGGSHSFFHFDQPISVSSVQMRTHSSRQNTIIIWNNSNKNSKNPYKKDKYKL